MNGCAVELKVSDWQMSAWTSGACGSCGALKFLNQELISHHSTHLALLVPVGINSSQKPKAPSFQIGSG